MIGMCDLHFLQILSQVMQTINKIMGKKIIFITIFWNKLCNFQNSWKIYNIIKCI